MKSNVPHFRIPINIPHAATLSARIEFHFFRIHPGGVYPDALVSLLEVLLPYAGADDPPKEEAREVAGRAAEHAREVVNEVERRGGGDDRFGQAIRNLFECLGKGEEGAILSLRAGENPDSTLRP